MRDIHRASESKWLIAWVALMSGILRRHPLPVLNQAARDPLDVLPALQDNFYSRIESSNPIGYVAALDWFQFRAETQASQRSAPAIGHRCMTSKLATAPWERLHPISADCAALHPSHSLTPV
jgi:hypothetical protein